MKRLAFVFVAACALVLASTSVAFANFGPHGAYTQDTDKCAECHRAHTSFSTVGWTGTDGVARASALLVSGASNMTDFCYACHGEGAPGAATNVQDGIYDSGPSGNTGAGGNVSAVAPTNSSFDATLNAGGFSYIGGNPSAFPNQGAIVRTAHDMTQPNVANLVRWGYQDPAGGAANLTAISTFTCTDCHDPHGSSNYRLLKDVTNGIATGGYNANGDPTPFVISNEQGFPSGGFRKGTAGVADVAAYIPNYTTAQYAKRTDLSKGISGWCSSCHTAYNTQDDATAQNLYGAALYNTAETYHRHPLDVTVAQGQLPTGVRALTVPLLLSTGLPLEMPLGTLGAGNTYTSAIAFDANGSIDCLTCHRAHGTQAQISGWAVSQMQAVTGQTNSFAPVPLTKGVYTSPASATNPLGTDPAYGGALLRFDNRGVCERCHNK